MAIVPKDKYPGQVSSVDPGYPLGKAQNISAPNDGTGTPFEADLVNDVFGMQQSLLTEAAITPSGVPDKVGASQYLAAFYQLIRSKSHTFANNLTYQATNYFKGNVQFWQDVTLYDPDDLANEVKYYPPRVRTKLLPLLHFRAAYSGGGLTATIGSGAFPGGGRLIASGDGATIMLPIDLPSGCTLTRVRAFVRAADNPSTTIRLRVISHERTVSGAPPAAGGPAPVVEALEEVTLTAEAADFLVADGLVLVTDARARLHWCEVELGHAQDAVGWVEVQFDDVGPRNF
jgi:hypothetical protein